MGLLTYLKDRVATARGRMGSGPAYIGGTHYFGTAALPRDKRDDPNGTIRQGRTTGTGTVDDPLLTTSSQHFDERGNEVPFRSLVGGQKARQVP